ncbi:MAG: DUF5916 domain-containing protein, partial [Gammaproteobacteria bacterium]|nr:DUF5916 domain-containing protein [Gammaproteobacteria bacterium]
MRHWLWVLLFCSAAAFAETQYWVAVGSYQERANAEVARDEAGARMAETFHVTPADTPSGYYYRVLAGPYLTQSVADLMVTQARNAGFDSAWLLASEIEGFSSSFDGDLDYLDDLPALPDLPVPAREPRIKSYEPPVRETPPGYQLNRLRRDSQARLPETGATTATAAIALRFDPNHPITLRQYPHQQANINIDGYLIEAPWSEIVGIDDFRVVEPDSLVAPRYRTVFKAFYTTRGLYMAWDMEQPTDTLVKRYSSRDQGRLSRDTVSATLDTSGEGRYGYMVNLALGGTQVDGTILPERQYSLDWDGAWLGGTAETDNGWAAEIFLPWSQVAMPQASGQRTIGIYASRSFAVADERWAYPPLPESQAQFMSVLQPMLLTGVDPRQQWSVFPYASVTVDEIDDETRYKAGVDVFWRPSTNFQLTATANPDFGNVESDEVIVNLTAFETFFPEKRLFFLEGQEIFNTSPRSDVRRRIQSGGPLEPTTIVNTRRIGGRPRAPSVPPGVTVPSAELGQPTELFGAVKTTGQFGGFRYGVLGASEETVKFDVGGLNFHQDGSDYGAARIIFEDNTASGAYRGLGWISTAVTHSERDAFVHAADFHYLSGKGTVKIDGQLIHSDIEDDDASVLQGKGYGGFVDVVYTQRRGLNYTLGASHYDDTVDINDMGFFNRNGATRIDLGSNIQGTGIPWVRDYVFTPFFRHEFNSDGDMTQSGAGLSSRFTLHNLAKAVVSVRLFPERYEDRNSFGNGTYRIEERAGVTLDYTTDASKKLSTGVQANYAGEEMGGDSYDGQLSFVWRPNHRVNLEIKAGYKKRQ